MKQPIAKIINQLQSLTDRFPDNGDPETGAEAEAVFDTLMTVKRRMIRAYRQRGIAVTEAEDCDPRLPTCGPQPPGGGG